MGSDETATATTGGPRVIDVFSGDGCHRVQIIYFFRMQIGPWTPSGIGLGSSGPLGRMRESLGLFRELWIEILANPGQEGYSAKDLGDVSYSGSGGVGGVGGCTRPVPTLSNPRETSGPRIDRIPPTRPPSWRRQYRELKKLHFSSPSMCPIDLFGPVDNGMILKQLRIVAC